MQRRFGTGLRFGLALAALASVQAAFATLGGNAASVEADRAKIQATAVHAALSTHTLHTLTMPNGTVVHEYLAPSGTVFAVTWHGRSNPDFRQILGANLTRIHQSTHQIRAGFSHFSVHEGDLIVDANGRAPFFHGRAVLESALPIGMTLNDIQ